MFAWSMYIYTVLLKQQWGASATGQQLYTPTESATTSAFQPNFLLILGGQKYNGFGALIGSPRAGWFRKPFFKKGVIWLSYKHQIGILISRWKIPKSTSHVTQDLFAYPRHHQICLCTSNLAGLQEPRLKQRSGTTETDVSLQTKCLHISQLEHACNILYIHLIRGLREHPLKSDKNI